MIGFPKLPVIGLSLWLKLNFMRSFLYTLFIFASTALVGQQPIDTTKGSIPKMTEFKQEKAIFRVFYYAPSVRGRVIYGGLVPFDAVWVAGAHRATAFEFNVPVTIGGKDIKPGKYAFFTIPGKEEWTIIINKKWDQHLADDYNESDDLVRLKVKPSEGLLRERLDYRLEKVSDTELNFVFRWEKMKISFPVKITSPKPTYKMPKKALPIQTKRESHAVHASAMAHAFSRDLPMNRNGSGTGWLPDETPMYAWMRHKKNWNLMAHGAIFFRQSFQNLNNDYARGGKEFQVPVWVMGMAQRKIKSNGLFMARLMMSTDPFTVGGNGYPLLLQSGETYEGQPIVDRQHPHDFISELSVGYTHRITPGYDISLYVGYPGEPAIGPTAFMHRISSLNNPDSPLGHHWQDATHITFGVATLGVRLKQIKLEASSFTGREPNEDRYSFDKPRFDSRSFRISYAPGKKWTVQVSHALIKSPESLEPEHDVNRTTASAVFSSSKEKEGAFTSTWAWGYNKEGHHAEHSFLWEGQYQWASVGCYARAEAVQKTGGELALIDLEEEELNIQALTLGTAYTFGTWLNTNVAIGFQLSAYRIPNALNNDYGQKPMSATVYLRIVPGLFKDYSN